MTANSTPRHAAHRHPVIPALRDDAPPIVSFTPPAMITMPLIPAINPRMLLPTPNQKLLVMTVDNECHVGTTRQTSVNDDGLWWELGAADHAKTDHIAWYCSLNDVLIHVRPPTIKP